MRRAALVLLAVLALGAASATGSELPVPDLAGVEPAVREQLDAARRSLADVLGSGAASAAVRADALGRLGHLYSLYGYRAAARAAFEAAAARQPASADWPYFAALEALALGDVEAATGHLQRVLELDPDDRAARLRLGQALLQRQELERAEELFESLASDADYGPMAGFGLARVAADRGDCEVAIERFRSLLRDAPEASAAHYPLALCLRGEGQVEEARRHLALRGDALPSFPDPRRARAQATPAGAHGHLMAALAANAAGDLERAIAQYGRAVAAAPESVEALRGLVTLLHRAGRVEEALGGYARLLELDPGNAVAAFNAGNLLAQRRRWDEAAALLRRALEVAPDYDAARLSLAGVERQRGDPAAARSLLREVTVSGSPQRAEAWRELAALELSVGDVEAALKAAASAVELAPADVESLVLHARLLAGAGRPGEAAALYGRAVDLEPDHEEARFGGALSLLLADREVEALAWLEAGVDRLPGAPELEHLLARLLAAAASDRVRDGARAESLARSVVARGLTADRVETLAMALAAQGRFEEAAGIQGQVVERLRGTGDAQRAAIAERRLGTYRDGRPVRTPWLEDR